MTKLEQAMAAVADDPRNDEKKLTLIKRLHQILVGLMFKAPKKIYHVDLRYVETYSKPSWTIDVGVRADDVEGHFNWVMFFDFHSVENLRARLDVVRAFAKGEIQLIPKEFN
jgi:hypothetical protein